MIPMLWLMWACEDRNPALFHLQESMEWRRLTTKRLLATGCWLLAAGCWLLASGYWLFVICYWILAARR